MSDTKPNGARAPYRNFKPKEDNHQFVDTGNPLSEFGTGIHEDYFKPVSATEEKVPAFISDLDTDADVEHLDLKDQISDSEHTSVFLP
jgi:hypothetical protein